jgi:hypothetical protein
LFAVGAYLRLLALVRNFGWQWVPVCDIRRHMPAGVFDFFCVGVSENASGASYSTRRSRRRELSRNRI